MRFARIATFQLIVVVALAWGAAVSDEVPANANALEGAQRTGRVVDHLSNHLALKKPWKIDQHLDNIKNFALANKDRIWWSVAAAAAAAAIIWIVSLFTGFDGLVKSVAYKMDSVKARAADSGLDAERLNMLTSRIFEAIDSWGRNFKHE